jgi:hypothetical protein
MFRRKKKEINPTLRDSIHKSFDRSLDDDHLAIKPSRIRPREMPIRQDGIRNGQIDYEMLMQLPPSWRRFWTIVDLDFAFQEKTELEKTDIISQNNVDVKLLSQDKKLQLKAITLGETRESKYSKSVGL